MMTLSRNCPQVIHKLRITYVNTINTGFSVEKILIFYVYNIILYIDKMDFFLIYIVVKNENHRKWKTKYWQKPYFMRFCLTLSDYFDINKNDVLSLLK